MATRTRAEVGLAEDYATHVPEPVSLWFVTPAWKRPELSEIVFEQRRRLCDELNAGCVVVANDENLEIARQQGFHTVERPPHPLGRKYNDGYEYAYRNGATHLCPLGSDSWALADYFRDLPSTRVVSGQWLSVVKEDGSRLAVLLVHDGNNPYGAGPFVIPRAIFPGSGRPVLDSADGGVDRNALDTMRASTVERYVSQLQEVSFKNPVSLDGYDRLAKLVVSETTDVWGLLGTEYPSDLVVRMRKLYERYNGDHDGDPEEIHERDAVGGDPVRS